MNGHLDRQVRWGTAAIVLAAAALACLGSPSVSDPAPEFEAGADEPGQIELLPEPTQGPTEDVGECGPPAEEMDIGVPVMGEVLGNDQPPGERLYYCVEIPDDVMLIRFELTSTEAPLNLFIGYPDMKTLQDGGLWLWYSSKDGMLEKLVEVKPGVSAYVNAGPYYIEVSAEEFSESSAFTLNVVIP